MACKECEARRKKLRDAVLHGKMAEAVGLTVGGLREMIGLTPAEAVATKAPPAPAKREAAKTATEAE